MGYIFVHGLGQNATSWQTVIQTMGERDCRCPELTDLLCSRPATYQTLFRCFSDYCNSQGEPVELCGLSLGGVLALNYAVLYPDRVRSLVLIGTQYQMPKNLLKLQNAVFRVMPGRAFQGMGFSKPDVIALTSSMMELDFSRELSKITCRTLVAYGEKDRANRKAALELKRGVPKAELAVIPAAGHEVNRDAPDALAALLAGFFRVDRRNSL